MKHGTKAMSSSCGPGFVTWPQALAALPQWKTASSEARFQQGSFPPSVRHRKSQALRQGSVMAIPGFADATTASEMFLYSWTMVGTNFLLLLGMIVFQVTESLPCHLLIFVGKCGLSIPSYWMPMTSDPHNS